MVTPRFWSPYGLWYLDINIANTSAEEGLMGSIAKGSWLPALLDGSTVGPKPASAHDRYIALYRTFADAWRLTDVTSLFVYFKGQSTKSYTDRDWPSEKLPCSLKQDFPQPANPIHKNISLRRAKAICKGVTLKDLNAACVFDVATTGDKAFARGYLIAQELQLRSTAVQIVGDKPQTQPGESLTITAIVLPLAVLPQKDDRPRPSGTVTFLVDGEPIGKPIRLNKQGQVSFMIDHLEPGDHMIRAVYSGGGRYKHHPSSSPNLLHAVGEETKPDPEPEPDPHHGHM
jgi:hypothetical protein